MGSHVLRHSLATALLAEGMSPAGIGAVLRHFNADATRIAQRNEGGLLVLTVPWGMSAWLRQKLGDAIVSGPEVGLCLDGTAPVANAWVRPRPGLRPNFPLGALGEVGVEAG